jgi:hypothetical protein
MSTPTTVWIKFLYFRRTPARKSPGLILGQGISDAVQKYADAVSIPYLITFGLEPHASATRERTRRFFDNARPVA